MPCGRGSLNVVFPPHHAKQRRPPLPRPSAPTPAAGAGFTRSSLGSTSGLLHQCFTAALRSAAGKGRKAGPGRGFGAARCFGICDLCEREVFLLKRHLELDVPVFSFHPSSAEGGWLAGPGTPIRCR